MVSVRTVLIGLGIAFTAYLAARGLWWTGPIAFPAVIPAVLGLYLATTWLCIFVERGSLFGGGGGADSDVFLYPGDAAPEPGGPGAEGADRGLDHRAGDEGAAAGDADVRAPSGPTRMPLWAAILAVVTALIAPTAIALAVGPASRTYPFATWYIGGIGALMTIVMVRRRPWLAWAGMLALTVGCTAWMGLPTALSLGLVGSIVWVVAAQALVLSLDRAAADTARLAELQQAASALQGAQEGRRTERRVQVQRALAVAGPVLTRVIATRGALDEAGRTEARLAEGRLRDELRGPRLLDDDVRHALEQVRRTGAVVTMLDEGGLDELDEGTLAVIRRDLAATLRGASSRRLFIRTSPHESIAVTVVGRQEADGELSDDDSVDLWREIPYPGR